MPTPTAWSRFRAGFEGKSIVADPVSSVGTPYQYATSLSASTVTPYQAWMMYKNVSAFAKVVDLIADTVAALVPVAKENGRIVDGHPVVQFLAKPGFRRDRRQFIKEQVVQLLVTGTGYMHVYGEPNRPPIAIDVPKSHFVTHTRGPDNWPMQFIYSEANRSVRFLREDNPRDWRYVDDSSGMALAELIPVIDIDGDFRGIGLPRLNAIRTDVELRLKGIQHNSSVLDKGARLSGILSFKEALSPEQEEAVRNQFMMQATGVANAGGVMVTSGGSAEFNALSQTMKDMDFSKLVQIVEDAIVSRFNIPVTLFRTEAQTNNNYETAWRVLYDQAILPTFQIVYGALSQMFSARLGVEIEIVHDSLTAPILASASVSRARDLFSANLVSRNEARQIAGYEPVLGGDIIYGSAGLVPQGEDLFTGIDGSHADGPGSAKPVVFHPPKDEPDDDEKPAPKKPKDKKSDPVADAVQRLSLVVDNIARKASA